MKRRLACLFLVFLVLSGSFSAQAGNYRCQAIFRPSLHETLVGINTAHRGFLFEKDLQSTIEDLSWSRRRKIRSILNHQFLGNSISEREVAGLATELSALLFGKRDVVDNYLFKTKDQRTKDRFESLMNEKILREGLINAWGGYSAEKTGALAGLLKGLRWTNDKIIFVNSLMFRTPLVLPLFLPKFKNKEISDELIQKVLLDGIDKHIEEIRVAMKSQNRIEAYNTFRRLYTPVIMGSAFTIVVAIAYMTAQQQNDEMVQKQLNELDKIRAAINQVSKMNEDIIERAYQGAREDFIQKWGEPPTDAEASELRNNVINGIKNGLKSQGGGQ